jgi:hypothetical protein
MNGPTRKRAAARGRRGVPRRLACSLYGEIQRRRPPRDRPALGAVAQPVSHIPRTRGPNGGPQPRFAPEDGVSSWSCTPLKALLPAGKLRDSSHVASPGLTVSAPMVRKGSPVRVRQRALKKARSGGFLLPRTAHPRFPRAGFGSILQAVVGSGACPATPSAVHRDEGGTGRRPAARPADRADPIRVRAAAASPPPARSASPATALHRHPARLRSRRLQLARRRRDPLTMQPIARGKARAAGTP